MNRETLITIALIISVLANIAYGFSLAKERDTAAAERKKAIETQNEILKSLQRLESALADRK
jgi:hypothetical protein